MNSKILLQIQLCVGIIICRPRGINMNIGCNLYSKFVAAVRRRMSAIGFDDSSLSDDKCVVKWHSWKRRIVPPAKRRILKASGFVCPLHLQQGLNNLEQAFIDGSAIWPWQSKRIDEPIREDGLFNDYGVVHFHLGAVFEGGGYVQRTRELLFAIVEPNALYEIGIFDHGDWYELTILDTIDVNRPRLLDSVTVKAPGISSDYIDTANEVKKLRKGHINGYDKAWSRPDYFFPRWWGGHGWRLDSSRACCEFLGKRPALFREVHN